MRAASAKPVNCLPVKAVCAPLKGTSGAVCGDLADAALLTLCWLQLPSNRFELLRCPQHTSFWQTAAKLVSAQVLQADRLLQLKEDYNTDKKLLSKPLPLVLHCIPTKLLSRYLVNLPSRESFTDAVDQKTRRCSTARNLWMRWW